MQKIVIVGNSISADIMYEYLKLDSRYEVVAFSVDKGFISDSLKNDLPVVDLEFLHVKYPPADYKLILAVGYSQLNQLRAQLFERVKAMGFIVETYIHPKACVYNAGKIGEGSIIMANTVVEVLTSIGSNTVIWANCVVGHHAQVGDNCWIASGTVLAGEVVVGDNSFLGVNVTISNKVCLAPFNVVGGHTAIHKNTKENEVYISGHGEKHRFPAKDYAAYFLK